MVLLQDDRCVLVTVVVGVSSDVCSALQVTFFTLHMLYGRKNSIC